ncbi:Quaternary ammonium compound-resistance protein QacC [Streptococcus gordonii]|nr:quaternary ammonium transporter [Streptococcus sp. HMSC10A01]RSJ48405.1 Quaternary ammonium compound-resistance protein QacC [Streptococcus gordonii]RSJ49007.1 Quaternary ammonium compound-resistance protein QacC [Streptococcus gordonii]RSJ52730.1 Quaternary ammonium compound-resistance protein QacC [Streptococcus gordonii]SQG04081.1 small multidrug resistance protein [Streptococcus gordonii]
MSYVYLTLAIVSEIAATSLLKLSQGFSKMLFGILALVFYGLCFFFLSLSLKGIQLNLVYAIWSGVGLVGTTVLSILLFHEKVTFASLLGIALVIVGLVILNLSQKIH